MRAFFKDPNVYGPFIVPVAIYALARLETASPRQIWIYSLLFAYCGFGILLGFSRGSWINFAVAMALFLLVRLPHSASACCGKEWCGLLQAH